jgi:dCTP deaminase
MMLGNKDIIDRLFGDLSKKVTDRLLIVPSPDKNDVEAKGQASLDLRLGRWFRSMPQINTGALGVDLGQQATGKKTNSVLDTSKEHFVRFGSKFYLHPGQFVLGTTLEWIKLPNTLAGYVTGKSSGGRRGLVIETAAGIHPGFTGCLTLELANMGQVPLELVPGMEICQLFMHIISTPDSPALSQFIGRRKPGIGRVGGDAILAALMAPKPPA